MSAARTLEVRWSFPVFLITAAAAAVIALSLVTNAFGAINPNCTLPSSVGYQNCVQQGSPSVQTKTYAHHCGWR